MSVHSLVSIDSEQDHSGSRVPLKCIIIWTCNHCCWATGRHFGQYITADDEIKMLLQMHGGRLCKLMKQSQCQREHTQYLDQVWKKGMNELRQWNCQIACVLSHVQSSSRSAHVTRDSAAAQTQAICTSPATSTSVYAISARTADCGRLPRSLLQRSCSFALVLRR